MNSKPIAACAAAFAATALTACGGGGAAPVTIHGSVTPSSLTGSVLGITAETYADCSRASPRPGTQVTVTSPSGTVIGTGSLGLWSHARTAVDGVTDYRCTMPFTVTGVPSEPRYGFQVSGVPGTTWVTSVAKGVSLSVTSVSG